MQAAREPDPGAEAEELARALLADLGDRWAHTQGVAAAADRAGIGLAEADRVTLVGAAWLHDIGYAPSCVRSGFHALDGARELLDRGLPARLAGLVAHHSMSGYEATARGLDDDLARFPVEDGPIADALAWADMTTDPQGRPTNPEARIAEILERYPLADPVHVAIQAAAPDIVGAVQRTEDRMAALVH